MTDLDGEKAIRPEIVNFQHIADRRAQHGMASQAFICLNKGRIRALPSELFSHALGSVSNAILKYFDRLRAAPCALHEPRAGVARLAISKSSITTVQP
ncbi:hypothetical protein [Bradyrhizobium pachyrhizi]|uniref:hypothetical protein n=1 Tax=Bradyrhizobium pachyrhizi TaxID=280333 RepID=UPI0018DFF26D|nr:hypothetical protein [Bradyrhizobium pachyrhizi]